jgi:hypothetical protein
MKIKDLMDEFERKAAAAEDVGAEPQARVWRLAKQGVAKWVEEVDDELLTVKDAAAETGHSEPAIRAMIVSKKVTNYGEPNKPLVRRGDLPRKAGFAALRRFAV